MSTSSSITLNLAMGSIAEARRYIVESVVNADYPDGNQIEALAILTDTLRLAEYELPSDIGCRVVMTSNGSEGVITGSGRGFHIFVDNEEQFFPSDEDGNLLDRPITRDDFTFMEDAE